MSSLNSKIASVALRFIVGVIFIYAAIGKIQNPGDFAAAIENYRILPPSLSHYAALLLPWIEIYCGLFLVLGFFVRSSAVTLSFLTAIFIMAISYALIMGIDINCGCFDNSALAQKVGFTKIIEDIILLLMGLYIVKYPYESFSITNKAAENEV